MDIFSEEQLNQVHQASLRVLEETGIMVKDQKAREIFGKAGARVNHDRQIVRVSQELVEKAIESSPYEVTLFGKNNSRLDFGKGRVHFINGFGTVNVFEWTRQTKRKATKQDLTNLVRVVDQMDQVAVVWPEIYPQDVPEQVIELHIAQAMLENTEKHCLLTCYNLNRIHDLIEIGKIASGGSLEDLREKPTISIGICATSPLVLDEVVSPCLIASAEAGIPIVIGSLAQGGATAPASLSGTLVVQNAELLGGLTLCQLVRPGNPFIWNDYASVMDQRHGEFVSSGPEMALLVAGTAQLCRYYQLPQVGTAGATDSNALDIQAGYEKALTILFAALSGAEAIHGAVSGWVEGLMTTCLEQIIVSNEICSYVSRLLKGMEVSPDQLALDVISEVGPGGNFLTHDHTYRYFKSEQWFPALGQRIPASQWLATGRKGVLDLATEHVKRILSKELQFHISRDTSAGIQEIIQKAEQEHR
jgi:trimethylamine--corrinoid protein Co-methyltransferase